MIHYGPPFFSGEFNHIDGEVFWFKGTMEWSENWKELERIDRPG